MPELTKEQRDELRRKCSMPTWAEIDDLRSQLAAVTAERERFRHKYLCAQLRRDELKEFYKVKAAIEELDGCGDADLWSVLVRQRDAAQREAAAWRQAVEEMMEDNSRLFGDPWSATAKTTLWTLRRRQAELLAAPQQPEPAAERKDGE